MQILLLMLFRAKKLVEEKKRERAEKEKEVHWEYFDSP